MCSQNLGRQNTPRLVRLWAILGFTPTRTTSMSNPNEPSTDSRSPAGVPKVGRRRLLQGGLAAAPVLMTLVSRPVLGQQAVTPSAFCSGNTSGALVSATSFGRSAGFWKQPHNFGVWPAPYHPTTLSGPGGHKATLFDSVFTPHYSGQTLLDVLGTGGGAPDHVARQTIAALLNIAAGWTPVVTAAIVKGIWNEYITKGYFEPTAGVHWDHTQIVTYLTSLTG